jgi:hypothetical protein
MSGASREVMMITRSSAIALTTSLRRRPLRAGLAGTCLAAAVLAFAGAAGAAPLSGGAGFASDPADSRIVEARGGRKAALIIGGIAALGAGAAIAAQNRRADPGYGYGYGGEGYAPQATYAPPPYAEAPYQAPVYAPAPVYGVPYGEEDDGWDYAPPPPPPVYPVGRSAYYGSYDDHEPSVVVDAYGRWTRLLPEGR